MKNAKTVTLSKNLRAERSPTIRIVARVVGTMVVYMAGVEHGILHYRNLERCKNFALRENKGNLNAIEELVW